LNNQTLGAITLGNVQASANVLSGEWIYHTIHRDDVNVLPMLSQSERAGKEESCHQTQSYESQTFIYTGFAFS
jgi:hypothetical protein